MTIRVGIVDDHPAMLLGTSVFLGGFEDLRVVAAVKTARALTYRCPELDVVLLDVVLGDGTSPAQNLRTLAPLHARVIAYTVGDRPRLVREAARAGVVAVIRKSQPLMAIVEAIRAAHRGDMKPGTDWAMAVATDPELEHVNLSHREIEVLSLYASGETRTQVAEILGIGAETVADHIRRIRAKYSTANRPASTKVDLFQRAVEDGIIPEP